MSIMRYEPWGLLNQLQRELERNGAEGSTATAEWYPPWISRKKRISL